MKTYRKSQITRCLSRCLFLEEILLTAAVASSRSSRVLVTADRAKQSKSPNERLNVALIGVPAENDI